MNTAKQRLPRSLALFVCLSCCVGLARAGGEDAKSFKHTPNEEKIFELTNAERKKEDVPPLKLNGDLSKIARAHSENMARQGEMAHNLDGKTPFDRIKATGLTYYFAGENVGKGTGDVTLPMLMKAWMDSEGHRKNILSKDYAEIGIGIARAPDGQLYYTQLFGKLKKK